MASRLRPWHRTARRVLVVRMAAALGAALLAVQTLSASGAALPATPAEISVERTIEHMSHEELIGQLIWVPVFGTQADAEHADNTARYGVATPAEAVARYHLGGVIYFGWADNIDTPRQLAELSNGLQDAARGEDGAGVPLAIGVDQEGGTVARIGEPATELPGGMALGAAQDPALARAQGSVLGEELAAIGINVDFAPTVDLNTNPANPVIGTRSMGEDPALVGRLGAAQLQGLWDGRVTGAAKHFPGHGDTDTDSHTGLPVVSYDRATLDEHLEPFATVIEDGASIIMTAHIVVEAIDPQLPATLSPDVLTGLLREEMGYDGIITTDALDMEALKQLPGNPLTDGDIAAMAIEAGADVLLMPPDVDAAIDGISRAMADGRISQERLEESVRRVLDWKKRTGLLESTGQVEAQGTDHVVGSEEHLATAAEVAQRGTTLLRNDDDVLPLAPGTEVVVATAPTAAGGDDAQLSKQLTEAGLSVVAAGGSDRAARLTAATEVGMAVVQISSDGRDADLATAQELAARGVPTIAVLSASPYDFARLPREIPAALTTYGSGAVNRAAAATVIAGEAAPGGWLPVTILDDGGQVLAERGTGLRLGHEVAPPAPEFTDIDHREATASIPDVAGVEYLLDGEPVAAGEHDFFFDAHVRARPTGRYWFDRGAASQWHHEVDPAAPTGQAAGDDQTASTAAGDEANSSGQPGWLLPVVLMAGFTGIIVITVSIFALRRRRHRGET